MQVGVDTSPEHELEDLDLDMHNDEDEYVRKRNQLGPGRVSKRPNASTLVPCLPIRYEYSQHSTQCCLQEEIEAIEGTEGVQFSCLAVKVVEEVAQLFFSLLPSSL